VVRNKRYFSISRWSSIFLKHENPGVKTIIKHF
jgi:hypothetical protein